MRPRREQRIREVEKNLETLERGLLEMSRGLRDLADPEAFSPTKRKRARRHFEAAMTEFASAAPAVRTPIRGSGR